MLVVMGRIAADARRQNGVADQGELKPEASQAVAEYLTVLDDAALGAAMTVQPKFTSPVDPAARWTAASRGPTVFAYVDNYLVDLKCAVIMDVEPTTAVRQAEVTAAKTIITRTAERLGIEPARPAADTGYGSAEMLAWLVEERGIEPHISVFDKSARTDGSLSRGFHLRPRRRRLHLPVLDFSALRRKYRWSWLWEHVHDGT